MAPVSFPPWPASSTTVPVKARTVPTVTVRPQGVPTTQPSVLDPTTGTTTPVGVAAAPRYDGASFVVAAGEAWTAGPGGSAAGIHGRDRTL